MIAPPRPGGIRSAAGRRRRPVSLRSRLVVTVTVVFALGLVVTLGATLGAVQDLRSARTDESMRVLAARAVESGARDPDALVDALGVDDPAWRSLAGAGTVPSFFQVRAGDGTVLRTVSDGPGPELAGPLDPELRPPGAAGASSAVRTVRSPAPGGDGDPLGWRVLSTRLPGPDARILVIATRTGADDEFAQRLAAVAGFSAATVLAAMAVATAGVLRRHLRPLESVAAAAGRLGAGNLGERVVVPRVSPEIAAVATSFNRMADRIEADVARLEASEQRMRQFVADASHELRTPLAGVRGYAELFRHGARDRPEDLAVLLERIELEAARMSDLVDELSLLARLDAGRPLERARVSLAEIAGPAVDAARVQHPDRDIGIDTPGSGDEVIGDAGRLRQVVDNLLANACRHTPPGGPVRVRISAGDGQVVLEVADSGPGIPPDRRTRVFDRFVRGDAGGADRTSHPGSGLGLSIVAGVVAAHTGRVGICDAATGGALVRVTLPAAPAGGAVE